MTKRQAGSKGGRTTAARYGPSYMREIGKRGAATTWTKYHWQPIGTNNFLLVDRQTGEVKARMLRE